MSLELLHVIKRARAENPKELLTADEVATCLYRAAQMAQAEGHDVGVLLKPHGAGGMCPVGRISLDIMIDIPDQQEYDAFGSADGENGAPGPAIPVWHALPFKVGIPPSGASMDRVRRPVGVVPPDSPQPIPPTVPDTSRPISACKAVDASAEVLDALHEMRMEQARVNEIVIQALARLENDNRKPRAFTGSARFIGAMTGEVGGVEG